MNQPDPKMVVNPTLNSSELLDELEGLELVYDALWALLEDVYQIQSIRDALEDRLAATGQASFPGDKHDVKH